MRHECIYSIQQFSLSSLSSYHWSTSTAVVTSITARRPSIYGPSSSMDFYNTYIKQWWLWSLARGVEETMKKTCKKVHAHRTKRGTVNKLVVAWKVSLIDLCNLLGGELSSQFQSATPQLFFAAPRCTKGLSDLDVLLLDLEKGRFSSHQFFPEYFPTMRAF